MPKTQKQIDFGVIHRDLVVNLFYGYGERAGHSDWPVRTVSKDPVAYPPQVPFAAELLSHWTNPQVERLTESVLRRVLKLSADTELPDWDHLGASPIPASAWLEGVRFFDRIAQHVPNILEPHISPVSDGLIYFEWESAEGCEFLVEFDPTNPSEEQTWEESRGAELIGCGEASIGKIVDKLRAGYVGRQ